MKRNVVVTIFAATLSLCTNALAEQTPSAGRGDGRIRNVVFDPDQVVRLVAYDGYEMMVQFADDEKIENVALGDSLMWQVTPNKRANLLFVKSVNARSATNMTVVSDRRVYHFILIGTDSKAGQDIAFAVRFRYPGEDRSAAIAAAPATGPAAPAEPRVVNAGYTYSGDDANVPQSAFDDGRFTYFRWNGAVAAPAVFARAADGSEVLIETFMQGGYTVIDRLYPVFVLRSGDAVTVIRNEKLITEQRRSSGSGLLAGLFGE